MKSIALVLIFIFVLILQSLAVENNRIMGETDSLSIQQNDQQNYLNSRGREVYKGDTLLTYQEVINLFEDYPEINQLYTTGYKYVKIGKPLLIVGIIGTSAGIVLTNVGQINNSLDSGSGVDPLYATGVGLGIVSVPLIPISIILKIMGGNKISGAVDGFNQLQLQSSSNSKVTYSLGITPSGLGLRVTF